MKPYLSILLALGACANSISGPDGFTPNSQLAQAADRLADGGPNLSTVEILLAYFDQGTLTCSQLVNQNDGGLMRTGRAIVLVVGTLDLTPIIPGEYFFIPPTEQGVPADAGNLLAGLELSDSSEGVLGDSVGGSVTLTEVSPDLVGSFNSMMALNGNPSGTLSGSFRATFCPLP
jgi:hypothetical protein